MKIAILLLIHACANDLFKLVPFYQVTNVFYVKDVGNFLIMMSLFFFIIKEGGFKKLNNIFSWLILYYILFAFIQAGIAGIKYEQSLIIGLIKTRDQLYYLSFFLYLYIFKDESKIYKFMDMLSVISFVLIGLSLMNYLGPNIFYHRWAEDESIRSGIERAFIPGMAIIVTSFIWQFNKFLNEKKFYSYSAICSLAFFSAIVFRQTRMLIIASTITALLMLFFNKRYKALVASIAIFSLVAIILGFSMQENILISPYETAVEDVSTGTGSWRGRMLQLQTDWREIRKNLWFGSGLSAIRGSVLVKTKKEVSAMSYMSDLGYTHWAKFYGIFGISWLIGFIISFYYKYFRFKKYASKSENQLIKFANYNFVFILIANVTQNYFMHIFRILIVCISIAILTLYSNNKAITKNIRMCT